MKQLLLYTFFFSLFLSQAQNLVPNPSFEIYTSCPTGSLFPNEVNLATPWYNPTAASPDYYNGCATPGGFSVPHGNFGYQNAHTGVAYVGCCVYGSVTGHPSVREYIQVQLLDSLILNHEYCVEFYVSLILNNSPYSYAIGDIGLLFSNNAVTSSNMSYLNYPAQINSPVGVIINDSMGWTLISGSYTATGGEKFITIGNFKNDANTDTLDYNYGYQHGAYYYIDDINIWDCPAGISKLTSNNEISFYPNPANEILTIETIDEQGEIKIKDVLGYEIKNEKVNKGLKIDVSNLNTGIYFVTFVSGENISTKKIIIQH